MIINYEYSDFDGLEKAVYRSLSGVISKKYKKTNKIFSYVLTKSILKLIKDNDDLKKREDKIKRGDLIKIYLEIDVFDGIVRGISGLTIETYELLEVERLKNIRLNEDALLNYIVIFEDVEDEI